MALRLRLRLLLGITTTACSSERAAPPSTRDARPLSAVADTQPPSGPLGIAIRRGRALVAATRDSLPAHVGNRLRCVSCHLDEGRRPIGSWIGSFARYPVYRPRSGTVETIEYRVNDCFRRSMNGTAVDPAGPDMRDIVAYLAFLSRGVAVGPPETAKPQKWAGFTADTAAIFTADMGVVSTAGMAAGFTAGMVASIRVTMDMAIPHTVTTAIDRVQLAAQNGAGLERSQSPAYRRGLGYLLPRFRPRLAWSGYLGAAISPNVGSATSARRSPLRPSRRWAAGQRPELALRGGDWAAAAAAVITVSEANARYIVKTFSVPTAQIHVIPCGVNAERFSPQGERLEPPHVVCVARLRPVKNLGLLLEACAVLQSRGVEFRCVLVGDGPCCDELEAMWARLGLARVVEFAGAAEQAEVLAWWQRATIAALTSTSEGMPVSLMEAAACGVPAVATAVGGIPELVEDGVTGLLVPVGDTQALAAALEQLLRNPELAARMGVAARRRVEERFTLTGQVDRLLELWTELVSVGVGARR